VHSNSVYSVLPRVQGNLQKWRWANRADTHVIGFSPQGDRVLFARSDFDRNGDEAVGSLWSVGVDGSDALVVVAGTTDGEWLSR
jgi:hypothetical protein